MPYFNEDRVIVDQFFSHRGMLEIYTHIAANATLFAVSLIGIILLYRSFNKEGVVWPGIIHGFFYTGIMGLGAFLEHIYPADSFLYVSLHYLHLTAAPAAMLFFYLAINEYYDKCSHPDTEVYTTTNEIAMGMFAGISIFIIIMGSLAGTSLYERLDGVLLLLIIIPLLVISVVFIKTSRRIKRSMIAFYFPTLGITLSALAITQWFGRFGDVQRIVSIYIVAHSLESVLPTAMATIMVLFVIAVREGIREEILYYCTPQVKSHPKKMTQKKDFDLTDQ